MSQALTDADWALFNNAINVDAQGSFFKDILVWRKITQAWHKNGYVDDQDNKVYQEIELESLVGYNYFRTWPVEKLTEGGEVDSQNLVVYLNKEYLSGLGYLTENGNFDYDPGVDLFRLNGVNLRSAGDTPTSQAQDNPLLVMLILKRELPATGQKRT